MSKEYYEANLHLRLEELRKGDPAYRLHEMVIMEAIIYSTQLHGSEGKKQRVLDCGCGLGFLTKEMSQFFEHVVGFDPSEKSIDLARKEHPDIPFHVSSAEEFPSKMIELNEKPFDHAVLNMVLHSVDSDTALNILKNVRKCLKPEGSVIAIVPTEDWIIQRLIEWAQDDGMEKEEGIRWIKKQLLQDPVELQVRLTEGRYYPEPIHVYQRSVSFYGELLTEAGFRVVWNEHDTKTGTKVGSQVLPYMDMYDYTTSGILLQRNRAVMMSFNM